MNNFHYRNSQNNPKSQKSTKLIQELQVIDRQLDSDYKKLADKRKLQEEFYEDGNKMMLADQVMKELLNDKQLLNKNKIEQPKYVQNINQHQLNKNIEEKQQINFRDHQLNFNHRQEIQIPQSIRKKVQPIINVRDVQKLKLQNKNAQQQFPFGVNSKDKERKNIQIIQSPERQVMKNNYLPNYENNIMNKGKIVSPEKLQNPFLKNLQFLKQKHEQQQRNYRRVLSEQMQQQKHKKNQEKQKQKQQHQQKYHNYNPPSSPKNTIPSTNEQKQIKKQINTKKRDPNAQYKPIQKSINDTRQSDLQFMKLQISDLRNKFKRGRINHEQYHMHVKKLQNHYKCKIDEVFGEENIRKNEERNENVSKVNEQDKKNQGMQKNNSEKFKNESGNQENQKKQKQLDVSVHKNKSTHQPPIVQYMNPTALMEYPPQQYPHNYNHFQPQPIVVQNPQSDIPMQMLLKLVEQFKGIIKIQNQNQMTILNDKKVLQDTLSKMAIQGSPMLMAQPIQVSQLPQSQKNNQIDKKVEKFDNYSKNNMQSSDDHAAESQVSSSYIEKSMSGIVNKIPLTKKQKQQQKKQDASKDISKFYERKYKIKKFKGFQYVQIDNHSNIVIPSISNFLQTKNSQVQLAEIFERDVGDYKKLSKQRDIQMLKSKLKKQKQQPEQQHKLQKEQMIQVTKQKFKKAIKQQHKQQKEHKQQKQQKQENHPFLKKHVSQEQNHPVTFTDKDFKGIFKQPSGQIPEILEQQQYQTSARKSKSPTKKQQQKYQLNLKLSPPNNNQKNKDKQYLSNRILNTMKTNNEILSKYQLTPARNSHSNVGSNSTSSIKEIVKPDQSKQISSREYFSGHDISPVQKREREYEDSLQTVRSEEQSMKIQRKQPLVEPQSSSRYEQYHHSPTPYSAINYPTLESLESSKKPMEPLQKHNQAPHNIVSYVQTVQSVDESAKNLPSFQKPPNMHRKNSRSTSRKKESVIKINNSDSFHKNSLSGILSQGSKQKSSSLLKAPSFDENKSNTQTVKSEQHQQIANLKSGNYRNIQNDNNTGKQQLHYDAPSFKQVLRNAPFIEKTQEIRAYPMTRNDDDKHDKQTKQHHSYTSGGPKVKSLQQARKLAKQYKMRAGEDHNRSSVEEKLSELQSIINTSKRQQSVIDSKGRKEEPLTSNKKKDIYKILDDLDEEQYAPDFESFKDQPEK